MHFCLVEIFDRYVKMELASVADSSGNYSTVDNTTLDMVEAHISSSDFIGELACLDSGVCVLR